MAQEEPETPPPPPPPPTLNPAFPLSLQEYAVTAQSYLVSKDKHFDGLATAALVFDPQNRTLLLRRAPHDSMPNRWEPPGGAVDDTDETILHACARELWEEAGLVARRIVRVVPEGGGFGAVFTNRTGRRVFCRFTFEVDVEDREAVRTDPSEHTDSVWATEEEVLAERMADGRALPITAPVTKKALLEGFQARRDAKGSGDPA